MPQVRKLEPSEIQAIQNKGVGLRKQTEAQYDSILADYEVGDYGEAVLDEGENRLTVRNRLKAAAGRKSVGINFRRTSGDFIRFHVVEPGGIIDTIKNAIANIPALISSPSEPEEPPPVVSSEPPAPAKRKGGRTKKS